MDVNEVIGACTSLIVVSLSAASVLFAKRRRKRQHSAWVKQYFRQSAKFGALTTLLPELADSEVTKCFQYLRVNKDTFQELTGTCYYQTDYKVQVLYCDILAAGSLVGSFPNSISLAGRKPAFDPRLGRKRARSITTCLDRSITLSTRFSTS